MRTFKDWSGVLALIPLIIGMLFTLRDAEVTGALSVSLVGEDIAIVFAAIALAIYAVFWSNFVRISQAVEVLDRNQSVAIAAISLAGLVIVSVSDAGWILFAVGQIGVGYVLYKSHLLPTGFGAVSGLAAIGSVIFGIVGGLSGEASSGPIFFLIAWSIIISVMYLGWGHPEERETVILGPVRSSRTE